MFWRIAARRFLRCLVYKSSQKLRVVTKITTNSTSWVCVWPYWLWRATDSPLVFNTGVAVVNEDLLLSIPLAFCIPFCSLLSTLHFKQLTIDDKLSTVSVFHNQFRINNCRQFQIRANQLIKRTQKIKPSCWIKQLLLYHMNN